MESISGTALEQSLDGILIAKLLEKHFVMCLSRFLEMALNIHVTRSSNPRNLHEHLSFKGSQESFRWCDESPFDPS
jgi:hypothetical protein